MTWPPHPMTCTGTPLSTGKIIRIKLNNAQTSGGGGAGGVTRRQFWYGRAARYFKTYPIHISGNRKKGPIHYHLPSKKVTHLYI